jgi:tripeptide aminopeptidase
MPRKTSAKRVKFNERAALARFVKLTAIPGASGRERAAVEWVRKQLLAAGARRSQISVDSAQRKSPHMNGGGDSGNLLFKLPGTVRGPRRLLMAHIDTVPLCEGCKPVRRGGRVLSATKTTALGADNRAGASEILTAALEILDRRLPHPPLTFMWTVQEEVGLCGARFCPLGKLGGPKLAFNWDGGMPDRVVIGATGSYNMDVVITGAASHAGGNPEEGVSAAEIFGLAVADLKKNGWHGLVMKRGVRGTSNIGIVSGGAATNVVMDRMEIQAEARAHDSMLRKRIVDAYRRAFRRAARRVRSTLGRRGRVGFKASLKYDSFELDPAEPIVLEAERAVRAAGFEPQQVVTNGGLDANWLNARGLRTVSLGSGSHEAHKVGEYLVVREHLAACRIALILATAAV